jgi:hypothetical protein
MFDRKLKAALRCAKRGWRVFPLHWRREDGSCSCKNPSCGNTAKHPLTGHGVNDATSESPRIRDWWQNHPKANIGIATGAASGLVVIDVDPRHRGQQSLAQIEKKFGLLPDGPRVRTGGDGEHIYHSHPGITVKSKVGIFPGIDIRGDGGYVVGPGSVHASGKRYLWESGKTPSDLPLPPLPAWLLNLVSDGHPGSRHPANDAIPEGQRNVVLASLAGIMRHRGMSGAGIKAALLEENKQRCIPPLDDDEVARIASSIGRYAPESLSTGSAPEVRGERSPRFQTAEELCTATPEKIEWIARPWIAQGSITEIDAKVKIGKTTWVTQMVRSVLEGLDFMGERTTAAPVVYLTEQPAASFRATLERADLLHRRDLSVLLWHETVGFPWRDVVYAAISECKAKGAKLLIVDTIAQFAKLHGDAENNAGDALLAMQPLQEAAAAGLGVIIVRHERKSGGDVGDSGRGSSAFAGAVDTIVSIRRPEGNTRPTLRVLHALSRFSETPDELVIELTPRGFVSHGTTENLAEEEARKLILATAPDSEEGAKSLKDLTADAKIKRATAQRAIQVLCDKGELRRIGEGKKRNPYRYWALPLDSVRSLHSDGQEQPNGSDGDEGLSKKAQAARAALKARLARLREQPRVN